MKGGKQVVDHECAARRKRFYEQQAHQIAAHMGLSPLNCEDPVCLKYHFYSMLLEELVGTRKASVFENEIPILISIDPK